MPRYSERQKILKRLELPIYTQLIIRRLQGKPFYLSELMRDIPEIRTYLTIASTRWLKPRTATPKTPKTFKKLLKDFNEDHFKRNLRMSHDSFAQIWIKIKDHPVFASNPKRPQKDIKIQMMVALERLGSHEDNTAVGNLARSYDISVGSVNMFTNRFITAILSLEDKFYSWPSPSERLDIQERMKNNARFPQCVGFVGEMKIGLKFKPAWNTENFQDGERSYSFPASIICDDEKLIRMFHTGRVASATADQVYSSSPLATNPQSYFSKGEYLLASSSYGPSENIIPAYKDPSSDDDSEFNTSHANLKVQVKDCINMFRARWMSCNSLRNGIHSEQDFEFLCTWIRCCVVLHNFLIIHGDSEYTSAYNASAETQDTLQEQHSS